MSFLLPKKRPTVAEVLILSLSKDGLGSRGLPRQARDEGPRLQKGAFHPHPDPRVEEPGGGRKRLDPHPNPLPHAGEGERPNETSSPRARKHQDRLYARPARELPALGVPFDHRGRDVLSRRHELWHRLRRRHAGGDARQERRRRPRDAAHQGRRSRAWAGRGAAHRRRVGCDSAPQRAARRRARPDGRGQQAAQGVRRRL